MYSKSALISLVVPVLNEIEAIDHFLRRVLPILTVSGHPFEIIFVDDGSTDATVELIQEACEVHRQIKLVVLSRNFGKEPAMAAGLDNARGEAVVLIDCDLQDPPELIHEMIEKWRDGFDVAYAKRRQRLEDGWGKRTSAGLFYRLMSFMSHVQIPENVGDFRLMDRQVVSALLACQERSRFMKGLAASVGFKQAAVMFDRPARVAGQTKWNYWKLWNFALDGITSFSTFPLRIWTYIGAAVALSAFIYAAWIVFKTVVWGVVTPGYATLMVAVLGLGGLQMVGLGIIGEYVARIISETKQRPLYFVARKVGFDPPSPHLTRVSGGSSVI